MANIQCKICQGNYEDEASFHRHLRAHKLKMADYYHQYLPRKDKYTGELIFFKNKEHYFSHDFNSRESMKNWIFSQPEAEARQYMKDLLLRRKQANSLVYAPTQVELRSILSPSMVTFQKFFPNYYDVCKELGYILKFKNIPTHRGYPVGSNTVIVDTREQLPYEFPKTVRQKLEYGDYALKEPLCSNPCHIERKSVPDFVGTLSNDYNRFENEILRAEHDKAYLVVLIEDTLDHCLDFKRLGLVSDQVKVGPEFIFYNVRKLLQKFQGLQFLFCNGRDEAAALTNKILHAGDLHLTTDLQYAYDKKLLV